MLFALPPRLPAPFPAIRQLPWSALTKEHTMVPSSSGRRLRDYCTNSTNPARGGYTLLNNPTRHGGRCPCHALLNSGSRQDVGGVRRKTHLAMACEIQQVVSDLK